jgi:integrase
VIETNWKKDYRNEFICPNCNTLGLNFQRLDSSRKLKVEEAENLNAVLDFAGLTQNSEQDLSSNIKARKAARFYCPDCHKTCQGECELYIRRVNDPNNPSLTFYTNHRLEGLVCPDCQSENLYFYAIENNKKRFICRTCRKRYSDSNNLELKVISRLSGKTPPILRPFTFEDDIWDLRNLILLGEREDGFTINFALIQQIWFKDAVKKYIHHLCRTASPSGIRKHIAELTCFSDFLIKSEVSDFCEIRRTIVLNFICQESLTFSKLKTKLIALRGFFYAGTIHGWFEIEQDLIRDDDYPKRPVYNPDPLSEPILKQIENNLYQLPPYIARMWIVSFFTAMRPAELAFLRQDCLVQEGENWKVVWQRPKTKDFHEVPVTRTIAKVIQEQREYIQNLWGKEWSYLFCHYYGFSKGDLTHVKLRPVKKVIPSFHNPLKLAIRCLIEALDIRDENGQLAQFSPRLLRPTRLTNLFEVGHDLAVVSAWAGHQSLATTSTYYTHVSCELIEKETHHIQKALLNINGKPTSYESFPKSFWKNPRAHELDLAGNHLNTPIYGYCALPLDEQCDKFRACYTCPCFFPTPEKLPLYIKSRDGLRTKESQAKANGQDVLVEQFGRQADQLDKVIARFQEEP